MRANRSFTSEAVEIFGVKVEKLTSYYVLNSNVLAATVVTLTNVVKQL